MKGTLSEDQRFLRDTVADLAAGIGVSRDSTVADLERSDAWGTLVDAGYTQAALADPTSSLLDLAVIVEEFGRHACRVPFLGSSVLATLLISEVPEAGDLLGELVAGTRTAAIGLTPDLRNVADSGREHEVIAWDCGHSSTVIALAASDSRLVVSENLGEDIKSIDLTRKLRSCRGSTWSDLGQIDPEALRQWTAIAWTMLAAEMVGIMAGALGMAVAYAKDRHQFGKPIGAFQAVQHLCADALVKVETARSAVYATADLLEGGGEEGFEAAMVTKAYASRCVRSVTETALQVHGGIGMTWEFPGHLFLRRGLLDAGTLGGEDALVLEIGARLVSRGHETQPVDGAVASDEARAGE